MSENTNLPVANPTTEVVDVALPSAVTCVGGSLFMLGFLLRCGARWLTRLTVERFHLNSEDAAYYLAVYIDLGLMALAFGLALFCVALLRRERVVPMLIRRENTKP